jgi:hypothetical protein
MSNSNSTKNINIDLNLNKNFISFLSFFRKNTLHCLTEIHDNLSSIDSHYNNNIGHSHTFSTIVQNSLSSFENFHSIDLYLNHKISSLDDYTIWKPVFNRDINYTNEASLLDPIITEIQTPLLKLRQVLFYFSLLWVDSYVTVFDDSNFSIEDSTNLISNDIYYKGLLNYMEAAQKKFFINAFSELKNNFEQTLNEFRLFVNKVTQKNENLNPVRSSFDYILTLLENIYVGFQNAKDELLFLLSENQEQSIVEIPSLSLSFRNNIQHISALLLEFNDEISNCIQLL